MNSSSNHFDTYLMASRPIAINVQPSRHQSAWVLQLGCYPQLGIELNVGLLVDDGSAPQVDRSEKRVGTHFNLSLEQGETAKSDLGSFQSATPCVTGPSSQF